MGRLRWASAILATGLLLINVSGCLGGAGPGDLCPAVPGLGPGGQRLGRRPGGGHRRLHLRCRGSRLRSDHRSRSRAAARAFDFLEAGIGGSLSNAGLVAKEALAAIDGKLDPTAFGGQDLLTALDATYDSTTHAYGDAQTYTQSLAILALTAAADAGHPLPAAAVTELIAVQDTRRLVGLPGRQGRGRRRRHELDRDRDPGPRSRPARRPRTPRSRARLDLSPRPAAERRRLPLQRRVSARLQRSRLGCQRDPGPRRGRRESRRAGLDQERPHGPDQPADLPVDAPTAASPIPGNPGPDAFTTSQVPAGLAQVPFPGSTAWTAGARAAGRASARPRSPRAGRATTATGDGRRRPRSRPATDPARIRSCSCSSALLGSVVVSLRLWSRRPPR